VLSSLLPGLRDLRTPLTCGLLWLLTAWLVIEPHLPESRPVGVLGSIYRLHEVFGTTLLTAAILFTSYVIGILLPSYKLPMHRIARLWSPTISSDRQSLWISMSARAELSRFLSEPVREASRLLKSAGPWGKTDDGGMNAAPEVWDSKSQIEMQVIENIADEEQFLAMRLLAQDKERLYQTYDRKAAEAQFRQGLAFPVGGLVLVLASRSSPWWLMALLVPVGLIALSYSSRKDAMDDVIYAVISGQIKSTAVGLLQQVVATKDVEQIRLWTSSSRRLSLWGYFLQWHDGAEEKLPATKPTDGMTRDAVASGEPPGP
jgi:hypothetical protein